MSSMVPDGAPRPRLAHLTKSPDFVGYGFNLHAEKGKAGQFIGDVDAGSPAATAGLRSGDRIVEVNGTNIANENHQQVVQRVKAIANKTNLLVVDAETDRYYREKKIVIRGDMPNIERLPATHEDDSINETAKPAAVNQTPDDSLQVRLCHLSISPDFNGYGFNLHSEKGKSGQFIGTIDPGSPAEAAGLHEGDRIFEVNDMPINNDEHKQVVQKIKQFPNKTKLLVADADTTRWYRQKEIVISHTLPNIKMLGAVSSEQLIENDVVTEAEVNHSSSNNQVNEVEVNSNEAPEPVDDKPEERVNEVEVNSNEDPEPVEYTPEERVNEVEVNSNEALEPVEDKPEERMNGDAHIEDTPQDEVDTAERVEDVTPVENNYTEEKEEETAPASPEPEPEPQPQPIMETVPEPVSPTSSHESYSETREQAPVGSGQPKEELYSMSVKEARARLGGRKKRNEVKQSGLSSKAKYDLFQKL